MYGPQNTSKLGSVLSFLDERRKDMEETPNGPLMSFKIQIPIDPMRRNSANGKHTTFIAYHEAILLLVAESLR